jgi:predicted nucleotidyltransferase component of viral defense system
MITKNQLKDYAKFKNLSLGNAEKDYLLELTLLIISRLTKNELIFKGGTALYKFHNLDRFSEDLDFSLNKELDLEYLFENIIIWLQKFSIKASIHKKIVIKDSISTIIRTEGPLFTGNPITYSKIEIDINLKSKVRKPTTIKRLISNYSEIPSFSLQVMDLGEILAEKTRALMTRNKARDLYDIWFIIQKNISFDIDLINEKLHYYNLTFDSVDFERSIIQKKKIWSRDLHPLISSVPDYNDVEKDILRYYRKQLELLE